MSLTELSLSGNPKDIVEAVLENREGFLPIPSYIKVDPVCLDTALLTLMSYVGEPDSLDKKKYPLFSPKRFFDHLYALAPRLSNLRDCPETRYQVLTRYDFYKQALEKSPDAAISFSLFALSLDLHEPFKLDLVEWVPHVFNKSDSYSQVASEQFYKVLTAVRKHAPTQEDLLLLNSTLIQHNALSKRQFDPIPACLENLDDAMQCTTSTHVHYALYKVRLTFLLQSSCERITARNGYDTVWEALYPDDMLESVRRLQDLALRCGSNQMREAMPIVNDDYLPLYLDVFRQQGSTSFDTVNAFLTRGSKDTGLHQIAEVIKHIL